VFFCSESINLHNTDEVKNLHDHIPAIDSMRTTVFGGPLGS